MRASRPGLDRVLARLLAPFVLVDGGWSAALDRQTLDDFIRAQRLVPEAEFLVRLQNRAEYNAEPSELSMLFVAQQTAVVAPVPASASETMRIAGGNSRLPLARTGSQRVFCSGVPNV